MPQFTVGGTLVDTDYGLFDKRRWNRDNRMADIQKQLEAEVARDMNKRHEELQFNASADLQRQLESQRFQSTENQKARTESLTHAKELLKANKEAAAQEENVRRERARQGLMEVEKETLNRPGSGTGAGGFKLPANVIPALADVRAGRDMKKADAAETLKGTIDTEQLSGALPLAKLLGELTTATKGINAKTAHRKAEGESLATEMFEPQMSIAEKLAAAEKLHQASLKGKHEIENLDKPTPDTTARNDTQLKIAEMEANARTNKPAISLDGANTTTPQRIKLNSFKAKQGTVAEPVKVGAVATPAALPPDANGSTPVVNRPSIPQTDSLSSILEEIFKRAKENNFNYGRLQPSPQ